MSQLTLRFRLAGLVLLCSGMCRSQEAQLDPGVPCRLESGALSLEFVFDPAESTHRLELTDARSGRAWTAVGDTGTAVVTGAERVGDKRLRLQARHGQRDFGFQVDVVLTDDRLTFAVSADSNTAPFEWLNYPPIFRTDWATDGDLVFCDRSTGARVPQTDKVYAGRTLQSYGNTDSLDLGWIGLCGQDPAAAGLLILFETPCDVVVRLEPDAEERLWPRPIWLPELGGFSYTRRVSYIPTATGGHVALARHYREWAAEQGMLAPLAGRARTRPAVDRLRGAVSLWGVDGTAFAREAREYGMRRALLNGNGQLAGREVRQLRAWGYLVGEYDNYTDFVPGQDGVLETDAIINADGSPSKGWLAEGGLQYYNRSSSLATDVAREKVPPILGSIPFNARFVDVSPAIMLIPDHRPERPLGRRTDMVNRIRLLRYLRDELGLVLGGEHANAWAVPYVDYSEGTMSGSFWWEMRGGYLVQPESRADLLDHYLNYGIDPTIRVPIYDLVFHDCMVSYWYWGDTSGFHAAVAPELAERKDLLNILHGTPAMAWVADRGYVWPRHRERLMRAYRFTCLWHEQVGFSEMLDHRYLSDDRLVQRSDFAGGAFAVVNFSDQDRVVELDHGTLVFPSSGFYAEAGERFRMERVRHGDAVRAMVRAPGYLSVTLENEAAHQGIRGRGTLSVFGVEPGRWNLWAEQGGAWRVELDAVPGLPSTDTWRLFRLCRTGEPVHEQEWSGGRVLDLSVPEGGGLYSLVAPEHVVTCIPELDPLRLDPNPCVLFRDSFDAVAGDTALDGGGDERRGGVFASIPYYRHPATGPGGPHQDAVALLPENGALCLRPQGGAGGRAHVFVSPDRDFAVSPGPDRALVLRFRFRAGVGTPSSDWLGVSVGRSKRYGLVTGGDGLSLLFDNREGGPNSAGNLQLLVHGRYQLGRPFRTEPDADGFHRVSLALRTDAFGHGIDGSLDLGLWIDGESVDLGGPDGWYRTTVPERNYIQLHGFSSGEPRQHEFDDLLVELVPHTEVPGR
jgi:hypothetical protein